MDWAGERARAVIAPFRVLFEAEAAPLADGLADAIAGELRGTAERGQGGALKAADELMAKLWALPGAPRKILEV